MAAIEVETRYLANDTNRPAAFNQRLRRYGRLVLPAIAVVAIVAGLQSVAFYRTFTPSVDHANRRLFDLVVESSRKELYEGIAVQVRELEHADEDRSPGLSGAWRRFNEQFSAAPATAIAALRVELGALEPGGAPDSAVGRLRADLRRFEAIHIDRYEPLLERLEDPPLWLWPTGHLLARYSGVGEVMRLDRALHLAQVGEIGTARVMLTGLGASTESPRMLGLVYYVLGRLEFELFRTRPDAELYARSIQYVRQSLQSDPDSELAKHFLDYLLSLGRAEVIPRAGGGEPTTPSEGEGAAVSADERRF